MNETPRSMPEIRALDRSAFSLLELLAVLAMIGILATFGGLAVSPVIRGSELNRAVAVTTALFEGSRQYALSHNTHTYVAFAEKAGGDLVVASFASPHGVESVGLSSETITEVNGRDLVSLARPNTFKQVSLRGLPDGAGGYMDLEPGGAQITNRAEDQPTQFDRIVHFTPAGEARLSESKILGIRFSLEDSRVQAESSGRAYHLSVSGITGQVEISRP
jgi:prepilin-type N-terminal cleavage/methylation domain-containing protein